MSYDPSHRKPPRQERWPQATPPGGWPSYRDGDTYQGAEQADSRYAADRQGAYPATAGYRHQVGYQGASGGPRDRGYRSAVATDTFPPARNGYGSAVSYDAPGGYGDARDGYDAPGGYGDARDGYDWTENGHGGNGYGSNDYGSVGHGNSYGTGGYPGGGYAGGINGYAGAADDFAGGVANGYGGTGSGYAGTVDGYPSAADGYPSAADGYADAGDSFAGTADRYSRTEVGYGQATDEYVSDASGYDWSENGYGSAADGYDSAADGYAGAPGGYAGDRADFASSVAYLGPGSYIEPGLADPGLADPMLAAPDVGADPYRWQADQDLRREARRRGLAVGAVTGFLAAAVAIGVSTLAAGFVRPQASPMAAMGSVFIDRIPAGLRNVVVQHFGTTGRTVLLLGMYAAIAVFAVGIGVLASRAATPAVAGLAAFSLLAAFVTITRPGGHVSDVAPAVIGGIAGVAALLWLVHASTPIAPAQYARGGARRRPR
jgi:hypothetical protein